MNAYIAKHIRYHVRMESRSGGAFTAFSDVILSLHGTVYGCELNRKLMAVHVRAENAAERDRLRGSKYVQSNMNGCLVQVLSDLQNGRYVLFTGTPCQVAGLYAYLKAKHADLEKLYTCTILCHYVTSPLLLEEYLRKCERKWGGKVRNIDFRNKKKFGWSEHWATVLVRDQEHDSTEYTILFYSGVATRECCFHCPYKSETLPGNIVLADAWGVQTEAPEFHDNKGVSLVLVNDEKGKRLFDLAKKDLTCQLVNFTSYNKQKAFHEPYPRPNIKDDFWKEYYKHSYTAAFNR